MKYWYAVLMYKDDTDWGYGSTRKSEAVKMARSLKKQGYVETFIAVIDNSADPVCVEEIYV